MKKCNIFHYLLVCNFKFLINRNEPKSKVIITYDIANAVGLPMDKMDELIETLNYFGIKYLLAEKSGLWTHTDYLIDWVQKHNAANDSRIN